MPYTIYVVAIVGCIYPYRIWVYNTVSFKDLVTVSQDDFSHHIAGAPYSRCLGKGEATASFGLGNCSSGARAPQTKQKNRALFLFHPIPFLKQHVS